MIKDIKKYYHVDTEMLSKYLNVSKNFIYAITSKKRNMKTKTAWQLMPLHEALSKKIPVEELEYVANYLKKETLDSALLKSELQKVTFSLENKQRKLKEVHDKRNAILRGLHACTVLIKNPKTNNKNWLVVRKKRLKELATIYTNTRVSLLESDILGLQTRVSTLKSLINNSKIETN